MSTVYDKGKIVVDGVELKYHFERAVVLYENDGGLVLRGDLKGVIAAFEFLKNKESIREEAGFCLKVRPNSGEYRDSMKNIYKWAGGDDV